jgi:hypothetical protein
MILSGVTGWKPVAPLISWQQARLLTEAGFFYFLLIFTQNSVDMTKIVKPIHRRKKIMDLQSFLRKRRSASLMGSGDRWRIYQGKVWSGLVLLAAFLLWFSPTYGGTISQTFTNNQYNHDLFFLHASGDPVTPIIEVANNRVELTVPPMATPELAAGGLECSFMLVGDFDIQVDFDLHPSWPANNPVFAGIVLPSCAVTRVNDNLGQGSQEAYLVSFPSLADPFYPVGTSDTSGTLRLKRTGNTMAGYYWKDGWQLIASRTDPILGQPTQFYIGGSVGNRTVDQTVKVGFDNLLVANQSILNAWAAIPLLLLY